MSDTQWPRYEVFIAETPTSPYEDVGSVHAPDAEIALFNARDVFSRRPSCSGMWIVPSRAILAFTNQEAKQLVMEETPLPGPPTRETVAKDSSETFYIFCKIKPTGSQWLLGTLQASNTEDAIRGAIRSFALDGQPYSWWIIPVRSIIQIDQQEIDDLFEPTQNRPFRLSTDFHTVSAMRQIKGAESLTKGENH